MNRSLLVAALVALAVTACAKKEEPKKEEVKGEEPAKAVVSAKFNPNDLKPSWQAWQSLKRDYAPQVYSPHYWRLYQESLLRYEHLVRAGDPTKKAEILRKKIDLLENSIKNDQGLDKGYECLGNSFPMARVLGFRPRSAFTGKELQAVLNQWKTNAKAIKPFAAKAGGAAAGGH